MSKKNWAELGLADGDRGFPPNPCNGASSAERRRYARAYADGQKIRRGRLAAIEAHRRFRAQQAAR